MEFDFFPKNSQNLTYLYNKYAKTPQILHNIENVSTILITMTGRSGKEVLKDLAGKDLNDSGKIVNLVVTGNSRFYDFSFIEAELEMWVKYNEYPDLVIVGGASGVDYLAERWAENQNIPIAVFTEVWQNPRQEDGIDSGRPQAPANLPDMMLENATHLLAFPGPGSVWTNEMILRARNANIPTVTVSLPMDEHE